MVREIPGEALDRDAGSDAPSCLELAGDLAGCFDSGRPDAATNRLLLEEAALFDADYVAAACDHGKRSSSRGTADGV